LGLAGAEWFATRTISLHAEYRASAYYSWREDKKEYQTPGEDPIVRSTSSGRWFFGGGGSVLFGLSLYF
jgi:hypothetical protein